MIGRGFQRVLVGAAVVVTMGATGSGVAPAATAVLSDQVNWSGKAVANPDGTVRFHSTKCKVISDGEKAVPCQLTGHGVVDPGTGDVTGTTVVKSSHGTITDHYTLTQDPARSGRFTTTGKCTEKDTPDPGQPQGHPTPCTEKGKGANTANPDGSYSTTSSFKVFEKSTGSAPRSRWGWR